MIRKPQSVDSSCQRTLRGQLLIFKGQLTVPPATFRTDYSTVATCHWTVPVYLCTGRTEMLFTQTAAGRISLKFTYISLTTTIWYTFQITVLLSTHENSFWMAGAAQQDVRLSCLWPIIDVLQCVNVTLCVPCIILQCVNVTLCVPCIILQCLNVTLCVPCGILQCVNDQRDAQFS